MDGEEENPKPVGGGAAGLGFFGQMGAPSWVKR